MGGPMRKEKNLSRVRPSTNKKWQRKEELALIDFIKQNHDFEKPCARVYYTKFLFESRIDVDWKLVRCKVRNMRTAYRRAKENEINKMDSQNFNINDLRDQTLKMCWYVEDFDVLFPNLMDNVIDKHYDPILDDGFSKDQPFANEDNTYRDLAAEGKNMLSIKKERQDEDTIIKEQEVDSGRNNLNCEKEKFLPHMRLKGRERESQFQKALFRNRPKPIRKWRRNEEVAIILFLKQNSDFEQPNARMYYTKFLFESGIDAEWKHVRNKVRNMRVSYRKAKEYEIKQGDSSNCNVRVLRSLILKICWFVDDFDILFPNEMDNSLSLHMYKNPDLIFDDDLSKDESFNNADNLCTKVNNEFLLEDDSSTNSFSNSTDGNILTMQKSLLEIKRQKRDEDTTLKKQKLELAKEQLNFEKEKFRHEIRLKEKEIENEEKLKMMEFQMKERIAFKKLEIEERLALKLSENPDNGFNDIYHNLS